jgi:hypothetical protein
MEYASAIQERTEHVADLHKVDALLAYWQVEAFFGHKKYGCGLSWLIIVSKNESISMRCSFQYIPEILEQSRPSLMWFQKSQFQEQ